MIAFHGDPAIKAKYVARVQQHRLADELVHGVYYEKDADGKVRACGVGCTIHSGEHGAYERELGIPSQLAHLEDSIFEALPQDGTDLAWPERFLSAISVGADLSTVWPRFAVWLMVDPEFGVASATEAPAVRAVGVRVAEAYGRIANGDTLTAAEQASITKAVGDAWAAGAAGAAWAARAARAAWAARDAWDARAAWAAAGDARDAWAAWAAGAAFVVASADKLVALLEATRAAGVAA